MIPIIPSQRLILLAACLLPLALLATFSGAWSGIWLVGLLVLLLLAVIDLLVSGRVLEGLRINVDPVTRFSA